MTFAYCTSIWTHHQAPVCRELAKRIGSGFKMVLFQPLDDAESRERMSMGWNLIPPPEPWVYGPPKNYAELRSGDYNRIIEESDVIVIGMSRFTDVAAVKRRTAAGKLTLFMGERYFKDERSLFDFFNPRKVKRWFFLHCLLSGTNVHYLTMNHWCQEDLRFLRVCEGRMWRWGYLTAVRQDYVLMRNSDRVRIGWCGRMLKWKCVDYILRAVALLPDDCRIKCEVHLVGNGPEEGRLKTLAQDLSIGDLVRFSDFMSADAVLKFMGNLDIYLFPSDRHEGWGAALLEAMSEGCVPVANEEAGATLEIVRDGENGFVFKNGDVVTLSRRLEWLIRHPDERNRMSREAWRSAGEFSPEVGACHLHGLVRGLLANDLNLIPLKGLCSRVR